MTVDPDSSIFFRFSGKKISTISPSRHWNLPRETAVIREKIYFWLFPAKNEFILPIRLRFSFACSRDRGARSK
ncbi:hypothetical protein LEP1GSC058_1564 [Leptospira fainei serovar Hurstbridge str. BUT 6]|uniref:Uncharacterized protein n=1 Tax=Leptospira fainei serovar Hurstbridge str. BUT 6 TaxID=1193011 RepID=S3V0I1_9LEPT|nr:hypothetical protein LEP1GSC058_1564 [Leptospira fainei serovar Hurstbridge str. BUT 6]